MYEVSDGIAPAILNDLVEGRTYQLDTSPDGSGGTRWDLFLYARPMPGLDPVWRQIATYTTAKPTGGYRAAALGWLRSMELDPAAMDVILILPDGLERLRPDAAVG